MKLPYEVQTDDENYYIKGPCPGGECSYYGGVLYPEFRFKIKKEAEKCAKLMNIAYQQGYKQLQFEMCKLLGAKYENK
jgi:hypothetical protein